MISFEGAFCLVCKGSQAEIILPEGFRPPHKLQFYSHYSGRHRDGIRLEIFPDGKGIFFSNEGRMVLDGIHFFLSV